MEDDYQLEHRNYLYLPQNPDFPEMGHEEQHQLVREQPHEMELHMVEIGDHHEKEAREPLVQDMQQGAIRVYGLRLVGQEVYKILKLTAKIIKSK